MLIRIPKSWKNSYKCKAINIWSGHFESITMDIIVEMFHDIIRHQQNVFQR